MATSPIKPSIDPQKLTPPQKRPGTKPGSSPEVISEQASRVRPDTPKPAGIPQDKLGTSYGDSDQGETTNDTTSDFVAPTGGGAASAPPTPTPVTDFLNGRGVDFSVENDPKPAHVLLTAETFSAVYKAFAKLIG